MILNPSIISLLAGSLLLGGYSVYSSVIGVYILRFWDIKSGSERQLALERKTYLVSTIFSCILAFESASLFLFVLTADRMHLMFTGAMCAAGSLNVSPFGYMALTVKILVFVLCGLWLVLNHADNLGYDYPLIRIKYTYIIFLTGLILAEIMLQAAYFAGLRADVITSCCGTIFSEDTGSIAGEMAAVPPAVAETLFFVGMGLVLRTGIHYLATGRGAGLFGCMAGMSLPLALVSVISFISLYHYRLPTHHCPFCLLQKEYSYIGYPLYLSLFLGGITGMGVGLLNRLGGAESLADHLPRLQRRLCVTALAAFGVFLLLAVYPMVFTDFVL